MKEVEELVKGISAGRAAQQRAEQGESSKVATGLASSRDNEETRMLM